MVDQKIRSRKFDKEIKFDSRKNCQPFCDIKFNRLILSECVYDLYNYITLIVQSPNDLYVVT